jgi:hypothetical protein
VMDCHQRVDYLSRELIFDSRRAPHSLPRPHSPLSIYLGAGIRRRPIEEGN